MQLRELNQDEFRQTFVEPMRRLGEDDETKRVNLKEYVQECIRLLQLPTTLKDTEIHHVYVSGGDLYEHVLFFYGQANEYLVIVVDHDAEGIMGHHLLNLNKEYGIS